MFNSNKKKKVHKVIEESYWEGFYEYLSGRDMGPEPALEYTSNSGFYHLNEVRRIAFRHGYNYSIEVIERFEKIRESRRSGGRYLFGQNIERKIPGKVYAECYGAARISA